MNKCYVIHVCSKQYKRKDSKNVNIVKRKLATLVTVHD